MAKIDKSKYTKQQIKNLLAERKRQKSIEKQLDSQPQEKVLNDHTRNEYGFVLGNGTSRKGIDLAKLQEFGKVYGCNALYREFDPDYLVAVDVKMILEIDKHKYQMRNPNVWTNPNKSYRRIEGLNYFKPSKGWSSGPTALHLSTEHNPTYDKIFILGFDYKGLEQGKLINNLYAGTPNYKKVTDSATYYGNWLKQTATVIKNNPLITFHRVITPDNFMPPELNKFSNFMNIYIEDFKKMFNLS
jgi:hypothetical protein